MLNLKDRTVPVRVCEGGIEWAMTEVGKLLELRKPRLMLVTDELVALHYRDAALNVLRNLEFDVSDVVIPQGEAQKTLSRVASVLDTLAIEGFARDDVMIGMGGGVVTDLAGFAAAIYKRGMKWFAVPTTLLGMVDAAIGGKTGVDHSLGKNMIGVFHQPLTVLSPLEVLKTLDRRQWRAGSAEVVKSALLTGGEFWRQVETHGADVGEWPEQAVHETVVRSAQTKIDIVSRDEKENGDRRLLNLGHTFAHALESVTNYSAYLHGEAVFLGLRAAVRMSRDLNVLAIDETGRIEQVISKVDLPRSSVSPNELIAALSADKKVRDRKLHWILLEGIGKPCIVSDVPNEIIEHAVARLCSDASEGKEESSAKTHPRILVINGPNLNLLGERELEVYGDTTHEHLAQAIRKYCDERAISVLMRQSNIEGELVSVIHYARHWADGIVINPGGYSHTSVAIRDAIASVNVPVIEVHISDISKREDFRKASLTASVCTSQIFGRGIQGYFDAIDMLTKK
jgi:3-dehydroquinate synthase